MKNSQLILASIVALSILLLSGCASNTPTNVRSFYTDVEIKELERATRCSGGSNGSLVGGLIGVAIGSHIGGSDRAKIGNALLGGIIGSAAGSGNSRYGRQNCNDNYYIATVRYIDPLTQQAGLAYVDLVQRPYAKRLSNVRIVVPKTPTTAIPLY